MGPTATEAPPSSGLDDLMREPGKAELIAGRVVRLMPTGYRHGRVAQNISEELNRHARAIGRGRALGDNVGYVVPDLGSGRQSFSPDASYYDGPLPDDLEDFVPGPPQFAAEVRSKGDHGPAAEADLAAKRFDYFQAGTLVVWDVDPQSETVAVFRDNEPDVAAVVYQIGELAEAEPALPGWRFAVADVFAP